MVGKDPSHVPRLWRRRLKRLRRAALAALAAPLVRVVSYLPRGLARALGRALGRALYLLFRSDRRQILANLELAFGDSKSRGERVRLARAVCGNLGENLLDTLVLQRWGPERILRQVPISGWDRAARRVDEVLEEGRGAIVLTGHFGNWEIIGVLGCSEWSHATSLVRRYEEPGYNRIVEGIRAGLGIRSFATDQGLKPAVRKLRENGVLGFLPDVDAKHAGGIFVDFFGHPAYTPSTPAALSVKLGTPMVPLVALRQGDGYRILSRPAIRPEEVAGEEDPVHALTERWCRILEEVARAHPDQWIWNHKRWHTTPEILAQRQERQRLRNRESPI